MKNAITNTTRQHYITSIAALNIPSLDGTEDWHFSDYFIQHGDFLPQQHLAEVDTISTRHLLGDYGIYECTDILKTMVLHHCQTKPKSMQQTTIAPL